MKKQIQFNPIKEINFHSQKYSFLSSLNKDISIMISYLRSMNYIRQTVSLVQTSHIVDYLFFIAQICGSVPGKCFVVDITVSVDIRSGRRKRDDPTHNDGNKST